MGCPSTFHVTWPAIWHVVEFQCLLLDLDGCAIDWNFQFDREGEIGPSCSPDIRLQKASFSPVLDCRPITVGKFLHWTHCGFLSSACKSFDVRYGRRNSNYFSSITFVVVFFLWPVSLRIWPGGAWNPWWATPSLAFCLLFIDGDIMSS